MGVLAQAAGSVTCREDSIMKALGTGIQCCLGQIILAWMVGSLRAGVECVPSHCPSMGLTCLLLKQAQFSLIRTRGPVLSPGGSGGGCGRWGPVVLGSPVRGCFWVKHVAVGPLCPVLMGVPRQARRSSHLRPAVGDVLGGANRACVGMCAHVLQIFILAGE